MLVWDSGTAITGSGELAALGRFVRLDLDPVPAYLSHTEPAPFRYRLLGNIGGAAAGVRLLGEPVQWAEQLVAELPADVDTIWYRLVAGVSGTLYRGVEVNNEIAIGCDLYSAVNLSIAGGTATKLLWDSERSDPFGMHSLVTAPARITIPSPGWYEVGVAAWWAAHATGYREVKVVWNDAATIMDAIQMAATVASLATTQAVSRVRFMNAGDYLEAYANQDSGGALNILANLTTGFWCVKVG